MNDRTLPRTKGFVALNAGIPAQRLSQVEGRGENIGSVAVKPLLVGAEALLLEIVQAKGVQVPQHQHDDHESAIYLVGRVPVGELTHERLDELCGAALHYVDEIFPTAMSMGLGSLYRRRRRTS